MFFYARRGYFATRSIASVGVWSDEPSGRIAFVARACVGDFRFVLIIIYLTLQYQKYPLIRLYKSYSPVSVNRSWLLINGSCLSRIAPLPSGRIRRGRLF